mmetsp:Transcript_23148/g.39172  ORF Transcript_23148/g.39172 Transcript_23148/m.39172 type:complete len:208 (+) Transcript_23148:2753-3376(+)
MADTVEFSRISPWFCFAPRARAFTHPVGSSVPSPWLCREPYTSSALIRGYSSFVSAGVKMADSMPKNFPRVVSLWYSNRRSCVAAMKSPPASTNPVDCPVSSSRDKASWRVCAISCMSMSLGRRRHTSPAECQVVPEVNWFCSSSTALTPFLDRLYKVAAPTEPPPIITTSASEEEEKDFMWPAAHCRRDLLHFEKGREDLDKIIRR